MGTTETEEEEEEIFAASPMKDASGGSTSPLEQSLVPVSAAASIFSATSATTTHRFDKARAILTDPSKLVKTLCDF